MFFYCSGRINADLAALFAERLILHDTVDLGIDGPVAADADIGAGMDPRAALADEDGAGLDDLTAEALDAASLAVAIATVGRTTATLFCCHKIYLPTQPPLKLRGGVEGILSPYIRNLDDRERLPVPDLPLRRLTLPEGVVEELRPLFVFQDLSRHLGPIYIGASQLDRLPVLNQEGEKGDFFTLNGIELFDLDLVSDGDPILLPTCLNNGVHKETVF